jgi:hypothetical protein
MGGEEHPTREKEESIKNINSLRIQLKTSRNVGTTSSTREARGNQS